MDQYLPLFLHNHGALYFLCYLYILADQLALLIQNKDTPTAFYNCKYFYNELKTIQSGLLSFIQTKCMNSSMYPGMRVFII